MVDVVPSELPEFMEGRYDLCERNTFLDFPAPKPLPLEKAQTDPPPGLEGLCTRKFVSETEHSEDSTAADDAEETPPPPLPLEYFVTPDCFEDLPDLPKPLSAAAPAFVPSPLPCVIDLSPTSESSQPRPRTQISLEEMLGPGATPPLVPMPVAGGAPVWLPAPPVMPAPMLAEPPSPEVPLDIAVAGPNLPANDLQPGHLLCQALDKGRWDVHWSVDSRQLYATTVRLVSSTFTLDIPNVGSTPFKAFLHPKVVINNKRGGGFKKAKGKGSVVLKCEAEDACRCPKMHVSFRVGRSGHPPRIIESHDFSEQSCCCLPDTQQEWDFRSLVDEPTGALLVSMRVEVARR
ncbi:unnamed protein product [Durusdinium trenchii]|uniref:Uncharacterized protein n=2 Tax=Durusdinium trenchii TaxID=1381693 RepID=A0ABP0SVA2_9DINO